MKELILGGARSGKSRLAENRARDSGLPVTFIATAEAGDTEMAERIRAHRASRPAAWRTIEATNSLSETMRAEAAADRCLIVDCLTLWLSRWLAPLEPSISVDRDPTFHLEQQALLKTLAVLPGYIILISNETGMGIVPASELSRRFRDTQGWLHQELAAVCDRVTLVVAGLPLVLKDGNVDA